MKWLENGKALSTMISRCPTNHFVV